jgi:hypothetical protein
MSIGSFASISSTLICACIQLECQENLQNWIEYVNKLFKYSRSMKRRIDTCGGGGHCYHL